MAFVGRGQFLTEEEEQNKPVVTLALIKRVMSYLRPYWKQMTLVLLAISLSSVLGIAPSVLTGRIIDEGLIGKDWYLLIELVLLSLGVTLGANLIGVLESYLNTWIAQHITYDMRCMMYRTLQRQSQKFFTNNNQGDIITRMTSDIQGVQRIITDTFSSILSNTITLIVALIAMFQMDWRLAIVGILVVPLFIIPTRRAGKTRWTLTREAQAASDEINGILNETLSVSGQLLVKLFGREEYEYERYEKVNKRQVRLNIKENMAGRWFRVFLSTTTSVGPMLLYLVGGYLIIFRAEGLSVGDITVFVALLSRMYGPVNRLLNIHVDWVRSMAMFTRIFEYFDMPCEITSSENPVAISKPTGNVRFENVSFSYDEERQILHNISFDVAKGKSIAIVGPSGSGKSTIVNLIPRLYDVKSGRVLVDNVDVRDIDLQQLRSLVGIVSQETYLFNGTIRENLLYANPEATEAELIEACKRANIYDFVSSQEKGLDTLVGNRGLKLSGGEKQRISIARVILKRPSILIFDEATSALDSISEKKIQEATEPLIKSHTSILIAHRLSTILAADEILVVKDGRIVERGTHKELVGAGGVYSLLYETQFKIER
ncbi:MAG: ABC transporter ATP-binding protein [Bacteroidales bacterium]|nr:ABC transporter ATP-binding protein [Bacteroidales bacterium]